MRRKTIWNESKDAYLREHYPTGTLGDIADALDMCTGTVSRRVKELGLKKAPGWDRNAFYGRYTGKTRRVSV